MNIKCEKISASSNRDINNRTIIRFDDKYGRIDYINICDNCNNQDFQKNIVLETARDDNGIWITSISILDNDWIILAERKTIIGAYNIHRVLMTEVKRERFNLIKASWKKYLDKILEEVEYGNHIKSIKEKRCLRGRIKMVPRYIWKSSQTYENNPAVRKRERL